MSAPYRMGMWPGHGQKPVLLFVRVRGPDAGVSSGHDKRTTGRAPALDRPLPSIECADTRIAYREAGPSDAPVILLLHGFPTSSHMFRDLIPLLSRPVSSDRTRLPGLRL